MKRSLLTTLLLATLFVTATAQYFPVDTARLNNAYRALTNGGHSTENEMEFLEAFPTTWLEFHMTYNCAYNESSNYKMCEMCSEHLVTLICLSSINDSVKCKKIVDLTIGMKDIGENTRLYQDFLVGYVLNNTDLVLNHLSELRRGHQMQFWQFVGQQ